MTTDYHGKIVEETSTYYVALEQIPYMRAFRRVKYYKDVPGSHAPETAPPVTQSYDLPTFRSAEVPASSYFTGGGGEFSGGGASSSYESSSSDSPSDSSSSSSSSD